MEAPLGVWKFIPSHFPTLLGAYGVTPRFPSWPATLQALALVASPRLGLQHFRWKIINWLSSLLSSFSYFLDFVFNFILKIIMVKFFLYVVCVIFSINIICSFEDKTLHFLIIALGKFIANFVPIFKWNLCTNIVYIYMSRCDFQNLELPFGDGYH